MEFVTHVANALGTLTHVMNFVFNNAVSYTYYIAVNETQR
jgi:hypothetical protein